MCIHVLQQIAILMGCAVLLHLQVTAYRILHWTQMSSIWHLRRFKVIQLFFILLGCAVLLHLKVSWAVLCCGT